MEKTFGVNTQQLSFVHVSSYKQDFRIKINIANKSQKIENDNKLQIPN